MKDPDWHHGPQEDDEDTVEQWEIDEATADDQGDDQWLDDNEKAYIAGFKAGSGPQEAELSAYERGVRAGIIHKHGGNN
jgi:hypothetical protein